ncbi:MAG: hypothetical protein K0R52_1649 [Alphaproteobacteria bacterium]|jgi:hypothetical protein|nr:hypothetical protein [Alphaproteobacteria bacterium]
MSWICWKFLHSCDAGLELETGRRKTHTKIAPVAYPFNEVTGFLIIGRGMFHSGCLTGQATCPPPR